MILGNLSDASVQQFNLFELRQDRPALMHAMDKINAVWGRGTLKLGAEGVDQGWGMRRENMSPRYTTCWGELPVVTAG